MPRIRILRCTVCDYTGSDGHFRNGCPGCGGANGNLKAEWYRLPSVGGDDPAEWLRHGWRSAHQVIEDAPPVNGKGDTRALI